ncbi:hypothetical protein HPB47_013983 [Ixodes persulcatus]|uniref:Uncharacterized protein n=1 Tax=Ixodes persulcatus TaxID=34615 RepID=A0AC60QY12_IXOPE|nr:hypothetical protein HPB47_013983 [Ixodes persulcatus]
MVPSGATHFVVDLVAQVTTFECSLWAFHSFHGIRLNGTAARHNVTTKGIRAPRKLAVTKTSTNSLSLEWEVNPNALNFSVSVKKVPKSGDVSSVEQHENDWDRNTTVCYNVTGLDPGARYEVIVRSCARYCGNPAVITAMTQVAEALAKRMQILPLKRHLGLQSGIWPGLHIGGSTELVMRLRVVSSEGMPAVSNLERRDSQMHDVPGNTTTFAARLGEQYNNYSVSVQAYNILLPVRKAGPAVVMNFQSTGEGPVPPRPEVDDIQIHDVELSWSKPMDKEHEIIEYLVVISGYNEKFFTPDTRANISNLQTWTEYTVNVSSCTAESECGPPKTSNFKTDADAILPGCTLCPTTIVMMIVIPVICIVLIAAYVLYRRALRKREERALLASEDTKGQEAAQFEREEDGTASSPPRGGGSIPALLQQLRRTESELERSRALHRAPLAASAPRTGGNDRQAEYTLRFLKDAVFYFLTDRTDCRGHLNAIQSILGFSEAERAAVAKAWRHRGRL